MRILVTGSRGLVGAAAVARLQEDGDDVAEFDIVDGQDVLDPIAVRDAATGCDVILHLAAIDDPVDDALDPELAPASAGSPESVLAVTAFVIVGRVDADVLIITAAALPAVVAGILTGGWLRTHLNPERFRRIVLGVLIATSISVTILAIVG